MSRSSTFTTTTGDWVPFGTLLFHGVVSNRLRLNIAAQAQQWGTECVPATPLTFAVGERVKVQFEVRSLVSSSAPIRMKIADSLGNLVFDGGGIFTVDPVAPRTPVFYATATSAGEGRIQIVRAENGSEPYDIAIDTVVWQRVTENPFLRAASAICERI